jgi:hypothetical protein
MNLDLNSMAEYKAFANRKFGEVAATQQSGETQKAK